VSGAKQERQRLIAGWLRSERIASQEELVARLAEAGVAATQATVSRDLEEFGAAPSTTSCRRRRRRARPRGSTGCWRNGSPTLSPPAA
jgi:arginine repressor